MKRVLVIGSGGSGKSTLARLLGELLDVEVVHLDVEHWRPGWTEPSKEDWRRKVEELLRGDEWIIDGNYSGTLETRLAACDTVVFLDLPRALCVWRALKRVVTYRKGRRPDMAEGCDEKFDLKFLKWIWDYPKRTRPKVLTLLEENARARSVYRLRSRAEVEGFLRGAKESGGVPREAEETGKFGGGR
ncbi:MAG TPA: DNA topology modulation protein [Pyrinomonadaceae bacterium]